MLAASIADLGSGSLGAATSAAVLEHVLTDYDRLTRPGLAEASAASSCLADAPADNVTIEMDVENLLSLDQKAGTYSFEGYLRLAWRDPRLTYSRTACGLERIALTSAASFWVPDIYFEASTDAKLGGNGELFSFTSEGDVLWSRHSKLELRCNMGFGRLPFDVQQCLFLVGLYSQTAASIHLRWANESLPLGDHFPSLPTVAGEWTVGPITGENVVDSYSAGDYSYAKACITFSRRSWTSRAKVLTLGRATARHHGLFRGGLHLLAAALHAAEEPPSKPCSLLPIGMPAYKAADVNAFRQAGPTRSRCCWRAPTWGCRTSARGSTPVRRRGVSRSR